MSIDLAAVYLKAANIIRTNGHGKGYYFTRPETGVGIELSPAECSPCVVGAISIVLTDSPVPDDRVKNDDFNEALARLPELIDLKNNPELEPLGRLAAWNDADDRTQDDVTTALEHAAKAVA